MKNRIGIAFVGGGGKGAYQIGVWKALRETGLDKQVIAVSGTSVGALNAAMFALGNYSKAEKVWKSLSPFQILKWDVGYKSLFTSDNLEKLITQSVDLKAFDTCRINCWITAWSKDFSPMSIYIPDETGNIKRYSEKNMHYFNLKNNLIEDRKKILLASAALPIVFPKQTIDSLELRDGGLGDNVPVKILYENEKCDIIIVIHLNQNQTSHDIAVNREQYPNTSLIEIWPKNPQGNKITGTLDFLSLHAIRRINQGYSETIDLFRDIIDCQVKAASSGKSIEAFSNFITQRINQNSEIYRKMRKLTQNWNSEKLQLLQIECHSLIKENYHRKLQLPDLKKHRNLVKLISQKTNNQYEINRNLMYIQQLAIDRIDLLQLEINAMSLWIKTVEDKVDLSLYIQSCKNKKSKEFGNIEYSNLSDTRKILLLAYDIASITHGTELVEEEIIHTACNNIGLPEVISLSKFINDLKVDKDALNLFIRDEWDYSSTTISSIGKMIYAISILSDSVIINNRIERKTYEVVENLYYDFVELNYQYFERQNIDSSVEIAERSLEPIVERRSNSKFIADKDELENKYITQKNDCPEKKYSSISQQCFDYIVSICNGIHFCNNDIQKNGIIEGNMKILFERLEIQNSNILLFHDDSTKDQIIGFAITDDGIHSYIDYKRQDRYISFEKLAEIDEFKEHTHRIDSKRFIESLSSDRNIPCIPIVPYEKIVSGTNSRHELMIEFLKKIRNACWVDLYL